MARYLWKNPPDILHVHGLFLGSFYCMVAAKLAGIRRIVLTVHTFSEDNVQVGPYAPLFDLADAYSIRTADVVHCIAQYQTENKMMRFARRIREVPVGLDVEQVKAEYPERVRTEFGIPQEAVLISCAGRLHFTKGFSYLLDALGMLSLRGLDLYCLIAGEGPERAELKAKIMRLGLENRVFLAGWRSDVHQIIAAGDIFCLPSLVEGMPKVTEEAMALSKPIVASAVFGVPEQVADGVNGLLTAPGNPRSLATALERYATNAELRRSHGEAGRRLVLERFNLDRMVSGINGIYEELLGESSRPGA
jgi:glycosyltransferase involved in cell wall biosynthesis